MSLTNILISWSKSPQYISNGRERREECGGERGRKKEEKVKEGKRKSERKRMARDGEYMRGN